jgi:hypothetical protein
MAKRSGRFKRHQIKLLKTSLLKPSNLLVLGIGVVGGILYSWLLIPIGVLAYSILCYLDISSEEFLEEVLHLKTPEHESPTPVLLPLAPPQRATRLETQELLDLQSSIAVAHEKIRRLHDEADDVMRPLLNDLAQTDHLVEKSTEFLYKAQTIRNYLAAENVSLIERDIRVLRRRIRNVHDRFARRQYQQALEARCDHLKSLQDMQQIYERLISQLTNIALSLDSMYSRMMKLNTSDYPMATAASEQVAEQLHAMLSDAEHLDAMLDEHLTLPD